MSIIETRGCRLAYDLVGRATTGVPMVWGHGLTSSRADEDVFPLVDSAIVGAHRQVARYDARGHGESSDLSTMSDGDWAQLALDQIGLIDHLGWDRVDLGGASMGAATALHAALRLRERVRSLVLVIPPTAWETRAEQVGTYAKMADAVIEHGTEPLVAGLRSVPPPDPFIDDETWYARRTAVLAGADPRRLAAVFRGAATADLPAPKEIAKLDVPTLVLAWSGDPGHPVSTADRLGQLISGSRVVVASSRAELNSWTNRVVDFLQAHDPR